MDSIKEARQCAMYIYVLGGPDLRGLSDAELMRHMTAVMEKMCEAVSGLGVPAAEAEKTFERFIAAWSAPTTPGHDGEHAVKVCPPPAVGVANTGDDATND